jgi:mannose-6-phosphate isomerase class I
LEAGEGILRLTPTWVPRSYLVPGRRLKLDARDLYSYGAHRGGIDERWIASTTFAMNENRTPDEGLSYVVSEGQRFTLKEAIEEEGPRLLGETMWNSYHRWPVYSKFFDNLGPIPHHLHQSEEQAKLVSREGKPEGYYFPPQLNATLGNFPHTYFGLEPGTTKEDIRKCLERWNQGDNGILDFSKAYRLKPGTGWLVPPRILHAPGSLLTYEPQWNSDVLSMFQSMVDGRQVKRELLVQDVPTEKANDLDFLVDMVDWSRNTDTEFKKNHYIEPITSSDSSSEGYVDKWVVYGQIDGKQRFSAKELTVAPGARCTIRDQGAYGLIVTQGHGSAGKLRIDCPALIRFGQTTEDEVFVSYEAANAGVTFENHSQTDPLVTLRYFGPDVNSDMPNVGDHASTTSEETI